MNVRQRENEGEIYVGGGAERGRERSKIQKSQGVMSLSLNNRKGCSLTFADFLFSDGQQYPASADDFRWILVIQSVVRPSQLPALSLYQLFLLEVFEFGDDGPGSGGDTLMSHAVNPMKRSVADNVR